MGRVLNYNVGLMGHIDSGKTSLARALSTTASTASMDKNPQSQERGITLDLGFSAFPMELPERLRGQSDYDGLQITLVDCPGHASLIKTIIGGSRIIDLIILVVDVTKGFQTQTAECLVIGEITGKSLIVALNKLDQLDEAKREDKVNKVDRHLIVTTKPIATVRKLTDGGQKMKIKVQKTLAQTRFGSECPIVAVSANPGTGEPSVTQLVEALQNHITIPERDPSGQFLFAVDHCFAIRGQGTVLTGTVLKGEVKVNQSIELLELKEEKKVKSMQMFRKPVEAAQQGDRVGICVKNLDAKAIERGIACEPGSLPTLQGCIAVIHKIRYFKNTIKSRSKFHRHATVMATVTFFNAGTNTNDSSPFDMDNDYEYADELPDEGGTQFALFEFEKPVAVPDDSVLIGSRLDTDANSATCRLAFYGEVCRPMSPDEKTTLNIFKRKEKQGVVDRVQSESQVIAKNMFKKETDLTVFLGLKVVTEKGESAVLESSFGKSGKLKVVFDEPIKDVSPGAKLYLRFKRYIYRKNERPAQ